MNCSITPGQVFFVQALDAGQMFPKRLHQAGGQDGEAVMRIFGVADDKLAVVEIDIFDAQLEAFVEAQSAAVENLGHQFCDAAHLGQDFLDFGAA